MDDTTGREPAQEQQPPNLPAMDPQNEVPAPAEPQQNPLAAAGVYPVPEDQPQDAP
jgi:hypothetical protein